MNTIINQNQNAIQEGISASEQLRTPSEFNSSMIDIMDQNSNIMTNTQGFDHCSIFSQQGDFYDQQVLPRQDSSYLIPHQNTFQIDAQASQKLYIQQLQDQIEKMQNDHNLHLSQIQQQIQNSSNMQSELTSNVQNIMKEIHNEFKPNNTATFQNQSNDDQKSSIFRSEIENGIEHQCYSNCQSATDVSEEEASQPVVPKAKGKKRGRITEPFHSYVARVQQKIREEEVKFNIALQNGISDKEKLQLRNKINGMKDRIKKKGLIDFYNKEIQKKEKMAKKLIPAIKKVMSKQQYRMFKQLKRNSVILSTGSSESDFDDEDFSEVEDLTDDVISPPFVKIANKSKLISKKSRLNY